MDTAGKEPESRGDKNGDRKSDICGKVRKSVPLQSKSKAGRSVAAERLRKVRTRQGNALRKSQVEVTLR